MGFTPQQVDAMSLWQFTACADGYTATHGDGAKPQPPTDAEFMAWAHGEGEL